MSRCCVLGVLSLLLLAPSAVVAQDMAGPGSAPVKAVRTCLVNALRSDSKDLLSDKRKALELQAQVESQIKRIHEELATENDSETRAELQKLLSKVQRILPEVRDVVSSDFCPTESVEASSYFEEIVLRIEECGTRNFPSNKGKRIYGALVAEFTINSRGNIESARVVHSSKNKVLDTHALRIINASAPFGEVPASARMKGHERFRFRFRGSFAHDPKSSATPEPAARCKL